MVGDAPHSLYRHLGCHSTIRLREVKGVGGSTRGAGCRQGLGRVVFLLVGLFLQRLSPSSWLEVGEAPPGARRGEGKVPDFGRKVAGPYGPPDAKGVEDALHDGHEEDSGARVVHGFTQE